jgi:hypothetical protein
MSKYPGRVLSATPPSVSQSGASGVWTQEEVAQYAQENIWPTQFPEDPFFQDTVLLLHGDGTNGAQNNTFLDSSTNNFTITRNGNTTQGSFSPFSKPDGRWGNYFDGSGDSLQPPSNTAFNPSGQDITVDFFVYMTGYAAAYNVLFDVGTNVGDMQCGVTNTGEIRFQLGGAIGSVKAGFTLNTWHYVTCVKSGTDFTIYLDAVAGTTVTRSPNSTTQLTFGAGVTGYLSNFRYIRGSAIVPTSIPTSPLTAIANTSLLTCQSNRFVDNSTNNFAITRNGDVKVTPYSPFPITTEYSPSVNGGSGYFDGSGDYLSVASNAAFDLGTGAFTWESWVYVTSSSNTAFIHGISAGFIVNFASSKPVVRLFGVADILTASDTLALNSWNHIAIARSGTTLSMWINGSRSAGGTVTDSSNFGQTGFNIGAINDGTAAYTGYMSSQRLVKGTAVYDPTQTTITVPTAPLTAITNTSLLCNFTNAGIYDNTGFNVLETVGNAQIDTTTKQFGTGSLKFDGNGDYLKIPADQKENLRFGTGDFTIEFWAWKSANGVSGFDTVISVASDGNANGGFILELSSTRGFAFIYDAAIRISSNFNPNDSAWHHYALVRNGSTFAMYKDGVQLTTGTLTPTLGVTGNAEIGSAANGQIPFNGYIDDLRITKGVARYTTTFTPPTAAFPNIGEP